MQINCLVTVCHFRPKAHQRRKKRKNSERMWSYIGEVAGRFTVRLCFLQPTRDKENRTITRISVMGSLNQFISLKYLWQTQFHSKSYDCNTRTNVIVTLIVWKATLSPVNRWVRFTPKCVNLVLINLPETCCIGYAHLSVYVIVICYLVLPAHNSKLQQGCVLYHLPLPDNGHVVIPQSQPVQNIPMGYLKKNIKQLFLNMNNIGYSICRYYTAK